MRTNGKYALEPVILGMARTPTGSYQGALAALRASELGTVAIKAALARAAVDPATIRECLMGIIVQAGTGQAPARQAGYNAGLPDNVGATTINKACGSGMYTVMMAANAIRLGEGAAFVAGGMESMSNGPHILHGARKGLRYGNQTLVDTVFYDALWCTLSDAVMGTNAERIAEEYDISRAAMDEFAYESHMKAIAAIDAGKFKEEIVPVTVRGRKGRVIVVDTDEPPRRDTNIEKLAQLRPAFEEGGRVTAGNAPGLNDGAAALVVTSRAYAERMGHKPLARIIGYTSYAVKPGHIFIAPAFAIPALLEKVGWEMSDVDLVELNEAFAAQVLADVKEMESKGLDWDAARCNVNGGAIALGHPVGASGARLLVTLVHALKDRGLKRGVAALCLGGGEATAMALEIED